MIPSFKQAVDRLFDHLGLDALYRANGEDTPVKVILKSPDQIIDFRVTDIAKPKGGDEIILDGASYRVQGEPVQDTHHLVRKMEVTTK